MDKVQKIREEIERLMYGFNLEADIASCEDAETEKLADIKYQLCKKILDYIDEVQKEPVSEFPNTESMIESYKQRLISQANGVKNSPLIDMCLASYKHGINETLDTLNLSNVQRTLNNWEKPKFKVGDRIKFKGIHNEDVTRVITDIKEGEGVGFSYFFADGSISSIGDDGVELVEKPVCKDLGDATNNYCVNVRKGYPRVMDETDRYIYNAFKAGAKWQREKDESTTEDLGKYINELSKQFPEVSFAKLSRIAVRVAKWKEEQMTKDAIKTEICERITQKGLLPSVTVLANGFKVRDKVKVIIIKED